MRFILNAQIQDVNDIQLLLTITMAPHKVQVDCAFLMVFYVYYDSLTKRKTTEEGEESMGRKTIFNKPAPY